LFCWSLSRFALICLFPTLAGAAPRQVIQGHIPAVAVRSPVIGALPVDTPMRLAIGLPLRNQAALTALLQDLYDPASPRYQQYLSVEEFTAQFGPSVEDYQAVITFLRANGFTKIETHRNRMIVDAVGPVGTVERAFHFKMGLHQHPTEARTFFAPDTEPSLDLAVPILHIAGLDSLVVPRVASLHVEPGTGGSRPVPQTGSGAGGAYRGSDFRHAYAPGTSLTGSNQWVGLLQFDSYSKSDITSYESQAGLPNVPLYNVLIDDADGSIGGGNIEVCLDIEMAISMAPGLAGVIVYEAATNVVFADDILSRMAGDNLAKQLSASWTFPIDSIVDQVYKQFAAQGQAYFNASGDNDAYSSGVSTPCDHPWVTSVGGTTLTMSGTGVAWQSETTWNRGGGAGTGGGISASNAIPSWQQGISMSSNLGSTTLRNIPDVAMVAESVEVIYGGGQQATVGGTSIATPLWAGFTALINQQAALRGRPPIGFLNPSVYPIGKGGSYGSTFHDITTGNNTSSSSPSHFFAVAGYDLCTGWGTPTGSNLVNALVPAYNFTLVTNVGAALVAETCTPTNGVIDAGETVTVSFGLRNAGGVPTTNLVATLLAGGGVALPSGPQTYGALPAESGITNRSFTFTASTTCGSIIAATLQLQDGTSNLGTRTFTFPTGTPIIAYATNFDGVTAPALPAGWTRAISGAVSNWITSTAFRDTLPNSAFVGEATNRGFSELISPSIAITSSSAQLAFRNFYNLECGTNLAYDGGVLEIKIGTGAFTDILAAGGTFVSGGYTFTIDPSDDNALGTRQCWSGLSPGFISTVVNLPASAAGKSIQLKWRLGTDTENALGTGGWYIDGIQVINGYTCCSGSPPSITGQPTNQTVVLGSNATFTVTATGTGPLNYQWTFAGTNLPGANASNLSLTGVQAAQAGSYQVVVTNTISAATSSVATLRVLVPPILKVAASAVSATNVSLSLSSVTGLNYTLQFKNTLTDAVWTPIPPVVTGNGGPISLNDTNNPLPPSRFYRVICN
jgi:hypothetical protein